MDHWSTFANLTCSNAYIAEIESCLKEDGYVLLRGFLDSIQVRNASTSVKTFLSQKFKGSTTSKIWFRQYLHQETITMFVGFTAKRPWHYLCVHGRARLFLEINITLVTQSTMYVSGKRGVLLTGCKEVTHSAVMSKVTEAPALHDLFRKIFRFVLSLSIFCAEKMFQVCAMAALRHICGTGICYSLSINESELRCSDSVSYL